MDYNHTTVALRGRPNNSIHLNGDKSIIITTDLLKFNDETPHTYVTLDDISQKIDLIGDQINLLSNQSSLPNNELQSIVYGERLVEILKWIIDKLVTHQHPPNAPPINTFFTEANNYKINMDSYILNKNVRHK